MLKPQSKLIGLQLVTALTFMKATEATVYEEVIRSHERHVAIPEGCFLQQVWCML